MIRTHDGSHGTDCFGCKAQSIQIDPRATPNRRNDVAPRSASPNWEAGVVSERRPGGTAMPYIHESNMNPIHVKEFGENRRQYTDYLRRREQWRP